MPEKSANLLRSLFRPPPDIVRPGEDFIRTYGEEFGDGRGRSHLDSIVGYQGKMWVMKVVKDSPEQKKRDLLAWNLGRGWLNVPEMRSLSRSEHRALAGMVPGPGSPGRDDLYLVRLAQDYRFDELPVRIPDKALAGELVFSTWIMRRDAHSGNRAFVNGVPVFFDFEQGFSGEFPEASAMFFRPGPDSGYVQNWRLYPLGAGVVPTTPGLRRLARENAPLALQPVRDPGKFWEYALAYQHHIVEMPLQGWKQAIHEAGFRGDRACGVLEFLESSASALDGSMEKIRTIMERPFRE